MRRPGLAFDDLPRPALVLLSHNHYDHIDLPSLRALQRRHTPHFVTMLGNASYLARAGIEVTELDWWDAIEVAGLLITATPARHFSARTPFDRDRSLWGGFMIDTPGARGESGGEVLFAGDSGAGPHWAEIAARLGAPDVALLPIGAYEPRWFMAPVHMDPTEAVRAHQDLRAARSVGMHSAPSNSPTRRSTRRCWRWRRREPQLASRRTASKPTASGKPGSTGLAGALSARLPTGGLAGITKRPPGLRQGRPSLSNSADYSSLAYAAGEPRMIAFCN